MALQLHRGDTGLEQTGAENIELFERRDIASQLDDGARTINSETDQRHQSVSRLFKLHQTTIPVDRQEAGQGLALA